MTRRLSFQALAAAFSLAATTMAQQAPSSSEFETERGNVLWTLRAGLGEEYAGELLTVPGDAGDDVLVGRPRFYDHDQLVGRVERLSGATGEVIEAGSWNGPLTSERRGDGYANQLAWLAGEKAALAVGRTRARCEAEGPQGARGELLVVDPADAGAVDARVCAALERMFFGTRVASIADIDGDGRDDVVVASAPRRSKQDGDDQSIVEVVSSADGRRLQSWTCPTGVFGFGVVLDSGDVDGDGVSDVIVGSQRGEPGDEAPTEAWVHVFDVATGRAIHSWTGFTTVDLNLMFLGDVDADGTGEIVIGGPKVFEGADNMPTLTVVSGADGQAVFTTFRTNRRAAYCTAFAPLGDVNADGAPDFAVSEPRVSRMWDGRGRIYLVSGADGEPLGTLTPDRLDAAFGLDMAAGQLVPGGPPELIVRALAIDIERGEHDELRAYDLTELIAERTR